MRLKTLRKKRPEFEDTGTIINGNRMDLSNTEIKPIKHRSNNSFALPTSLNNDLSSLTVSISDHLREIDYQPSQQTLSQQRLINPAPSQATRVSSYQAIEAAYREHGIRIHLDPTAAAAVSQQQFQTNGNQTDRKSASTIHRIKAFVNRNPSRASSALHYPTAEPELYQESRPFSALQQTSMTDFEGTQTNDASYSNKTEKPKDLKNPEQSNINYCASSILVSEPSDNVISQTKRIDANDASTVTTMFDNDPDVIYMTSLLQTNAGDSYRDTIRRRAGLRPTLAVHRHPQSTTVTTITATTTSSKRHEKSSVENSPTNNTRKTSLHQNTISVVPIAPPSKKKVEKDIVKHATRIRASQLKDYFNRQDQYTKSTLSYHGSSLSNSPSRTSPMNKQHKRNKPVKSISLEPLELLLSPALRSPSPETPSHITSVSSPNLTSLNHNNHQRNVKRPKRRSKSAKLPLVDNNNITPDEISSTFFLPEHESSLPLNDEKSPLIKTSILGMISSNDTHQSNSTDSGCYDRSSCSGDTHSITSLSINHTLSAAPSARITSASTRRSNVSKKVSFKDQPRTIIITTAIYV